MDYEQILYDKMCRGCLFEKDCHDDAKNCDEYLEELEKMNEMEIINLLKDYHDYYNLDCVEIVVEGNRWTIKGCQDKRIVVERYGEFDK